MSAPETRLPLIRRLEAHVLRWPVETPVRTSFGVMHDRPMVLVEAECADGVRGWGEVWCNFPAVGAEHRARLIESVFAPMLVGAEPGPPAAVLERLTQATAVLAIQSAEPGPIAQCIAGIDIALWDLAARRAAMPLWRLLGGSDPAIAVYASGLNPDQPERLAEARRREGYTAFKLKVGFGAERDIANLRTLRAALGAEAALMVDANQAWTLDEAKRMAPLLEPFALQWLEEPLRADTREAAWRELAAVSRVPLAAGENLAGDDAFDAALSWGAFGVVQPDIAKWGGLSRGLPLAGRILAAGARFCPHYLGGGVGLLASAHLLAAAGGGGLLEVDSNPNPLRSRLCGALAHVRDGSARLDESPGLGIEPDLEALRGLCR